MATNLAQGKKQEQSAAPGKTEQAQAAPFAEMLNAMFDSGLEVQKSYQKSMEQIFDTYRQNAGGAEDEDKGAEPPPPERD